MQLQDRADTENAVTIESMQASQEADLGSDATFALKLERSSVDVRRFQLKVVNIFPHRVAALLWIPAAQARLYPDKFSGRCYPAEFKPETLPAGKSRRTG